MEALIIGIASAFNFLIIKMKIERGRYQDAAFDGISLFLLTIMFSGSLGGMIIATVGSAIISLALLISPPKFLVAIDFSNIWNEIKSIAPEPYEPKKPKKKKNKVKHYD